MASLVCAAFLGSGEHHGVGDDRSAGSSARSFSIARVVAWRCCRCSCGWQPLQPASWLFAPRGAVRQRCRRALHRVSRSGLADGPPVTGSSDMVRDLDLSRSLGHRHRSAVLRKAHRWSEACASALAQEDVGWLSWGACLCGRYCGWCRAVPAHSGSPTPRLRDCGVLCRTGGGSFRVHGQTPRRPQRQRSIDSGPWRRAGPHRFHSVRSTGRRRYHLACRLRSTCRRTSVNLSDLHDVHQRRISILGSTGSIGKSTLSVIAHLRDAFGNEVFPIQTLTAQSNVEALAEQARRFRPARAVIGDDTLYSRLGELLSGTGIEFAAGTAGVVDGAAADAEVTMLAIVGAAGLAPALAAVQRGGLIALANKECVVAAGQVFRDAVHRSRATIIPVDSGHSAAFQLLDPMQDHAVERLTLTASGGPFRSWPKERIARATPEQAVAHP